MKARKRAVEEKKCHMSWLSKNSPQLHGSFRFLTHEGKDCVKYEDNTGFRENNTVFCFVLMRQSYIDWSAYLCPR